MKKCLTTIFLSFFVLLSFGQEFIIKDFAEPKGLNRWLNPICLYPSTLRMINISQNPQYDELVNDIEKILIYTLDSATTTSKSYTTWLKEYEDIGYKEYISVLGKQEIRVIGKKNECVGLVAMQNKTMVFYLRGKIHFAKIPALMQYFQNNNNIIPMITEKFK